MLLHLSISNYALIDELEIDLKEGKAVVQTDESVLPAQLTDDFIDRIEHLRS